MEDNWNELAKYLRDKSKEICEENHCADDHHYCDSYAYITDNGALLDICRPDYFLGVGLHGVKYAAISLPWDDDGSKLRRLVREEVEEA